MPCKSPFHSQQEAADQEKKIDTLREEKNKIVQQLEGLGSTALPGDASPVPANGTILFLHIVGTV